MKTILVVAVCFVSVSHGILPDSEVSEQWNNYKRLYIRKRFLNPKEETFRRAIFEEKLQEIEDHNERYRDGLETYTLGVNQFTAYTDEEILPFTNGLDFATDPGQMNGSITKRTMNFSSLVKANIPDSFNWLDKVTPVKYQGGCGSCWAFAAVGALEAHYKMKYGQEITFSEQQLVDCVYSSEYIERENGGCAGGTSWSAYTYIEKKGGINYDNDYPYEGKEGNCRFNPSKPKVTISDIYYWTPRYDEELMKQILYQSGPFVTYVNANFTGYNGGVYYNQYCSTQTNHAMVIVGYGVENGLDYWLVKNSWGASWGMNGYIKLARNRNNHCGIANDGFLPVL